jgi:hypothetical protein
MEAAVQMSKPVARIVSEVPKNGFQLAGAADYLGFDAQALRVELRAGRIEGFPADLDLDSYRFRQLDLDRIADHFDAEISAGLGPWAHVCKSLAGCDRARLFELTSCEAQSASM